VIQHTPQIKINEFREFVSQNIIFPELRKHSSIEISSSFQLLINEHVYFVIGGPESDSGLTGRKIIADTYGCDIPHGGGGFSGKDASKIDRTGAYLARYISKNIVTAGLAKRCLITLSFALGMPEPINLGINTFHTNIIEESHILT
jgi:S-adenosylmethionine synthetase